MAWRRRALSHRPTSPVCPAPPYDQRMSTVRRPLGTGPRPTPSAPALADPTGPRRVRAAEADVETDPLSRPGELEGLALFRERGVLGPA